MIKGKGKARKILANNIVYYRLEKGWSQEDFADAFERGGEIFGISAKQLAETATIYMVPMVDPDGVDLVTGAIGAGEGQ